MFLLAWSVAHTADELHDEYIIRESWEQIQELYQEVLQLPDLKYAAVSVLVNGTEPDWTNPELRASLQLLNTLAPLD